jgi:uroporphyrinogen-III synthase
MRVIVTRPAAQAGAWVERLQALGVDAVALPLIGIEPATDPIPLQEAWAHLDGAALAMFVSPNAVAHFFEARPPCVSWPPSALAGSTGPGTTQALREAGVPAARIVAPGPQGPFDSEAVWGQLRAQHWTGRRALIVRGDGGRDWLSQQLRAAGAAVDFVSSYRRVPPTFDAAAQAVLRAAQAAPGEHRWHFSSSEAVAHLHRATPQLAWSSALGWATHPRIVEAAQALGFAQVELIGPGPEAVAAALAAGGSAPQ